MGFKPSVTPNLASFQIHYFPGDSENTLKSKTHWVKDKHEKGCDWDWAEFLLRITVISNVFLTFTLLLKFPPKQLLWAPSLYTQLSLLDVSEAIIILCPKMNWHSFSENAVLSAYYRCPQIRPLCPRTASRCPGVQLTTFFSNIIHHLHTAIHFSTILFPKSLPKLCTFRHTSHLHYQVPVHTTIMLLRWLQEPSKWTLALAHPKLVITGGKSDLSREQWLKPQILSISWRILHVPVRFISWASAQTTFPIFPTFRCLPLRLLHLWATTSNFTP